MGGGPGRSLLKFLRPSCRLLSIIRRLRRQTAHVRLASHACLGYFRINTMSLGSTIEWTDATWNPVRGCTKISSGCAHCYAATFSERFRGVPGHPYEQGFDLRLVPENLVEPLKWSKSKMVFVNSMSDLFHKDVPDDYIELCTRVMVAANWHTFQVLTKRSERMRDLLQTRLG